LNDFDSLLNFLSFCNLVILANVLDHRTYQLFPGASDIEAHSKWDANAIPAKERYDMAYARGRCWELLYWVFDTREVFHKETGKVLSGFEDIAMPYLAHLGSTIMHFKRRAKKSNMDYDEGSCTIFKLDRQVKYCMANSNIPSLEKVNHPTLDLVDRESYEVRTRVPSEEYQFQSKHGP
jgi:hypothetical protein